MRTFSAHLSCFLTVFLSIALTGCETPGLTGHLWSADWSQFNEPAPNPRLAISRRASESDFLVEYDELPVRQDDMVRRAYLLLKNNRRIEAGKKPAFEKTSAVQGGQPFRVYTAEEKVNGETNRYIRFKLETRTFELFDQGRSFGRHSLPVYKIGTDLPLKIALTPFALTADLAAVGFIVGIYCWPSGTY